jgi:P-type E1-E2 ATPase
VALVLGRAEFLRNQGVTVNDAPDHDGPVVGVAHGGILIGWLTFADEPRADARAALSELRHEGLTHQVLLTGDRTRTANTIATGLGLSEVRAEATPADKLAVVRSLTAAGRRPLVVGDGLNDVLALKAGAVGVAMGSGGIDAALASADVVLTSDRLSSLAVGLRLSRRCRTIVGQNVAIGLGWTGIVVTAVTWGGLGPVAAVLLHHIGTLAVVANSGRLLGYRDQP